jgi:hypothetical protein
MKLECIKGYATNENIVFLQGDIVKIVEAKESLITLEGEKGYSKGTSIDMVPKIVAKHFKTHKKK